jgi:hypothetical protein
MRRDAPAAVRNEAAQVKNHHRYACATHCAPRYLNTAQALGMSSAASIKRGVARTIIETQDARRSTIKPPEI